jgi:HPt (histidine-containing phosphotransfer) domain-containing protein
MNWSRVTELKDEVGVDAFTEVLELFLEEIDEMVVKLKAGPDPGGLAGDLHFMKGAALNLGFDELAMACTQAEADLRTPGDTPVDVTNILQVYAVSRAELTQGAAAA